MSVSFYDKSYFVTNGAWPVFTDLQCDPYYLNSILELIKLLNITFSKQSDWKSF